METSQGKTGKNSLLLFVEREFTVNVITYLIKNGIYELLSLNLITFLPAAVNVWYMLFVVTPPFPRNGGTA